jgi:transmembrane sensor
LDDLIIRVLQGQGSTEDLSRLRSWRALAPGNEAHYRALARVWENLAEPVVETAPPPLSVIREKARAERYVGRRRGSWAAGALAASVATLLAVYGATRLLSDEQPVLQIEELATGAAETLMAQLSDGTTVYLAPGSKLRVTAAPGVREVWLEGRAFFGVAEHGTEWPFVVRSGQGAVHVLGTRFELSTAEEQLRVIVVEGEVDLAAAGERVQLVGGQIGVARADGPPSVLAVASADTLLGWMGRTLIFSETPLEQAAQEIERAYGAEIELRGDVGRETIVAAFNDRSFAEVLTVVCRVTSAECLVGENRALISARLP